MTKGEMFIEEWKELCEKHEVQVSVSGYNSIVLHDLKAGEDYIYCGGIEDETRIKEKSDSL